MSTLTSIDHFNNFIQDDIKYQPGNFPSAEFVTIAVSAPTLSTISSVKAVYPIGVVQNFNLTQQKVVSRLFELGSARSYLVPGKSVGALSFARPFFSGPSLLKCLTGFYDLGKYGAALTPSRGQTSVGVNIPPGYENLFINLASDLFNQALGITLLLQRHDQQYLGCVFFETSYIVGHSMAIDSNGIMWTEGVQIQFERMVPVNLVNQLSVNAMKTKEVETLEGLNSAVVNLISAGQ
jgi:hypothetical protein